MNSLPVRRIRRKIATIIDRTAGVLTDVIDPECLLRCNACDQEVAQFTQYGGRPNHCPKCGSSCKERFVLALIDNGNLEIPSDGPFLHIAPSERQLALRFREKCGTQLGPAYVTADLMPDKYSEHGAIRLDLTNLSECDPPLGEFRLVYASHVLEHIPDDRMALRSIWELIGEEGEAWILVPLRGKVTVESAGDETMSERERKFGQWDHVRQYGDDLADRLVRAHFEVSKFDIDHVPPRVVSAAGLSTEDVVWRCRRAA